MELDVLYIFAFCIKSSTEHCLLSVEEEELLLHFPEAALELVKLGVSGEHWHRQSTEQHQDGRDLHWCLVSLRSVNLTVCMMSNRKSEYRD